MTRAEERALKAYPVNDGECWTYPFARQRYIEGYEQAEKDLAHLIESAAIVYEAWNGGTMDDVRKGMIELGNDLRRRRND